MRLFNQQAQLPHQKVMLIVLLLPHTRFLLKFPSNLTPDTILNLGTEVRIQSHPRVEDLIMVEPLLEEDMRIMILNRSLRNLLCQLKSRYELACPGITRQV